MLCSAKGHAGRPLAWAPARCRLQPVKPWASAIARAGRHCLILVAVGIAATWAPGSTSSVAKPKPASESEPLGVAAALHHGGAAALAHRGLNAPERRLFADAANGRLDEHSLLVAALVASGVDSQETLDRYQQRLDEYTRELKRSLSLAERGYEEVEAVFDFLHARILHGGYRIDCTDLRIAMDEGRFNCVSASVLFQCLAEACGFAVSALEMPGHAMSRVHLPDGPLDIETTCAGWFRLMHDPKQQARSVQETLGAIPRGARNAAREVSNVGLVAMVYYNRGVDLLADGRYAEAALANAKAMHLDPGNRTARGNLLATVNNWAIALGHSGRLDEAIAMLRAGLAVDPQYEPFVLNYAHMQQQQAKEPVEEVGYQEGPPAELPVLSAP